MRPRRNAVTLFLWLLSAASLLLIVSIGIFSERYFSGRAEAELSRRRRTVDLVRILGGPQEVLGGCAADRIVFRCTTTVGGSMQDLSVTYRLVPGTVAPASR